jgi:membrane-bound lytic murein transglycosylase B
VASLLAGGGLTAAVLGGAGTPFTGGALAAEAPAVTQPAGTTTTGTTTTPPETPQTPPTTTSTTTTAPPPPTTSSPTATGTTQAATTPTPATTPQAPNANGHLGGAGKERPARVHTGPNAPTATTQQSQQTTTTPDTTTAASSTQAPSPVTAAAKSSTAIAPAPQLAAVQSSAIAAMMNGSSASLQALAFYRIPPFLLPIYQAAAVQYGVPWQVLAAINEVETDFGTDLSVSSAGAVGWMQFMPETWLQYGVDALNAGYADPYNPVDAIFAAARYLHAAGASTNLRTAILAYNHSEAYVESVLLRARLFASYPNSAIATLTGLTEGAPPAPAVRVAPGSPIPAPEPPTPAAGAAAAQTAVPAPTTVGGEATGATAGAGVLAPAAKAAKTKGATAAKGQRSLDAPAPSRQLSTLLARRKAPVVAVEDGRIVAIGVSHKLGDYLVLRDTYGDVFTYASLGSLVPDYRLAKPQQVRVPQGALPSGAAGEPTPKQPASAGSQSPLTMHVATRQPAAPPTAGGSGTGEGEEGTAAAGKVRVFAHPDNPDARLAKRLRASAANGGHSLPAGWALLRRGALVAQGTVLGHLGSGSGQGADASLRFAIRPAGAQSAVDPRPILENWRQLAAALHPHGARAGAVLAGATATDAFNLSAAELERAVLSDPGIKMGACDRSQVAAGRIDQRALALLVFLSRSGLKPTVGQLSCGSEVRTGRGATVVFPASGTIDVAAINGVPIAGHQGAGTVTDVTIRTLLTIKHHYAPSRIVSLMSYPGAPDTIAAGDHATFVGLEFAPKRRPAPGRPGGSAPVTAASAGGPKAARTTATAARAKLRLDTLEWQHLIDQIATIQQPKLAAGPSAAAIRDARP